jgi:hypothetical protein
VSQDRNNPNPSLHGDDGAVRQHDPRIIELVKFLARNAAQRDYNKALENLNNNQSTRSPHE